MPLHLDTTTNTISFETSDIPESVEAGIYDIRVDYEDDTGVVRSSYYQDNALVVSGEDEIPLVVSTDPMNNQSNVPAASSVQLNFNVVMDLASINAGNISIVGSKSGSHTFTVSPQSDSSVFTLTPDENFDFDETVTVTLSTDVQSSNGINLESAYLFDFQTNVNPTPIYVSGTIDEDTTWSPLDGVYVINGNVTVNAGVTLSIEPGTIIKFDPTLYSSYYHYSMTVNGILDAQGTVDDPIYFTSLRDDTVGGDTNGDGGGDPACSRIVGVCSD